jgi:hypothetical protein
VRLFDPHLGGVVGKGTLLPLNSSVLPPGTLVLRQSQVKAPVGKTFWAAWSGYWQQLLIWAHQQHLQQQRQWPAQGMHFQQQQQQVGGSFSRAGVAPANSSTSSAGGPGAVPVPQVNAPTAAAAGAAGALEAAVQAAAVAAAVGPRAEALRCFNAQDQPWMQQLWYVHDAMQLNSSSSSMAGDALVPGRALVPPPARPDCRSHCQQQQQQWPSSSSSSSSGVCGCEAVLEVVSRPPDSSGKNPDLKISKNLLLLLHHAGVPLAVFEA